MLCCFILLVYAKFVPFHKICSLHWFERRTFFNNIIVDVLSQQFLKLMSNKSTIQIKCLVWKVKCVFVIWITMNSITTQAESQSSTYFFEDCTSQRLKLFYLFALLEKFRLMSRGTSRPSSCPFWI